MALICEDRMYGYRIKYRVYSIDGTFIDKSRSFKSRALAEKKLHEIERLEKLSSEKKLTSREIAYFIYRKFINVFEARSLTREQVYIVRPYELAINETRRMIQSLR